MRGKSSRGREKGEVWVREFSSDSGDKTRASYVALVMKKGLKEIG